MPNNVLVAVMGEGEYLPRLVRAILDKEIIPARNMFLSSKNAVACKAAEGYDVRLCEDVAAALLKSEIVLVTASKREMPTQLTAIANCAQKRIVVTVCNDERIDLAYVRERVPTATEFIAAVLRRDEAGRTSATFEIAEKTRLFLHQPCRDLVNALCDALNEAV